MRILIAEDERVSRKSLLRQLERWGYDVDAAEDGAEAWDLFQQQPYDLVITDWDMPRMDGQQLIERIRSTDKAGYSYLIMLTSRSEAGLLLARAFYDRLGGFRPIPLMEDVDMVRRIGRRRLDVLDWPATTSAARYAHGGYVLRPLRNVFCVALFFLGLPSHWLVRLYG